MNNEILGPYEKEKLLELPVFSAATLLCPQAPVGEKTEEWKEASAYPEIAAILKQSGAQAPQNAQASGPAAAQGAAPAAQAPEPSLTTSRRLSALAKPVEPTPPPSQEIASPLEVNQLGSAKSAPGKDEPSFAPSFDPLTISEIRKRGSSPQQESPKPAAAAEQPAEIQPQSEPQHTAAQPPERFSSGAEPAAGAAPAGQPLSISALDNKAIEDINAKLDVTTRIGATKDDIEILKERITHIGETLAAMKNDQFHQELIEKVNRLETAVSEIKGALAQRSPAPQAAPMERQPEPALQPRREPPQAALTSAEARPPKAGTETVIVDQGSRGKASGGIVKRALKFVLVLAGLAVALFGTVVAMKFFGGPDLTGLLPVKPAFLAETPAEPPADAPFQQDGGAQAAAGQASTPAPAAAKKDISPEIIFFGRQYALKTGGPILEGKISEDAAFRKGNFNKLDWQARELPGGTFELSASIPLLDNSGKLSYRYEVDYAGKSLKAMDAMSQKPLDALAAQKPAKPAAKARGQQPARAKAGAKRSAAKNVPPKPGAAAKTAPAASPDEEYEYVYEDEAGAE